MVVNFAKWKNKENTRHFTKAMRFTQPPTELRNEPTTRHTYILENPYALHHSCLSSAVFIFIVKKSVLPTLGFDCNVLLHWSCDKPSLPSQVQPSRFAFLPKIPSAWGWKAGCCEQARGCAWLRLQSCSRWRCLAATATCTPIHLCLRARPLRVTDHLTQVLMTSMSALHATKYIYRPRLEQSAGGVMCQGKTNEEQEGEVEATTRSRNRRRR